jgi:two-component system LytT family response regulator
MIRTLIVDDEPIARQVLREEIEEWPEFVVLGEAENGRRALDLIREERPDLVFLDLQMPVMGGLDVVRQLTGPDLPIVVIVTAFDEYAVEAFETGALDYLLKPIRKERIEKTLERVKRLRNNRRETAETLERLSEIAEKPFQSMARKIVARLGHDYHLLNAEEILAFQAEGEIVWIVTQKQRMTATRTLRSLEEKLSGLPFQRVRRDAIVNMNHVRKMSSVSSHRWLLTLSNAQELVVSKRMAHDVRQLLRG